MQSIEHLTLNSEYRTLVAHFHTLGLSPRPGRAISVHKSGANQVTIIPVVDLKPDKTAPFHRTEGGIAVTYSGEAVGCLATIDERTRIVSLKFVHPVNGSAVEGMSLTPEDVRSTAWYDNPQILATASHDPGGLATYAFQSLSSDAEAREMHPELDYNSLFGADNISFLTNAARTMFQHSSPLLSAEGLGGSSTGIIPMIPISHLCTCTCTTGCTCSCCATSAELGVIPSIRPYLDSIGLQMGEAVRLLSERLSEELEDCVAGV